MHQIQHQQQQPPPPPMQPQAPLHQPAMVYDNPNAPSNAYQALNHSYSNNHHHHHHQLQQQQQPPPPQQQQQPMNSAYYGSHEVQAQVPVQQQQPPPPPPPPPPPSQPEHQVPQYNMQPQQQASISPQDTWSNGGYYQPSQSPYPGSMNSQPYPPIPYNGAGAVNNHHGTPPCHQPSPIPAQNHNIAPQPMPPSNHYMHPHSHPPPPSHPHQNGVMPVQPAAINHSPVMHQQPMHQQQQAQQQPMHQSPQQSLQQQMHQQQQPIHQQPHMNQQAPTLQPNMVYDNLSTPTNTYSSVSPYSNNHHHQQQPPPPQQQQQPMNSAYYGSHEVQAQVPPLAQPEHQYNMQPQQQASISPQDTWSNGGYYQPSQSPYPGSMNSQPYPTMPYNSVGTVSNHHGTPPCHQPSPIPAPNTIHVTPQPIPQANHYMHPPHQPLPGPPPHQMQHQQHNMNQIAPQPPWQPHSQMPIIERNKTAGQEKKPVKPRAPKKQTNPNAPSGRRKRPFMTEEHKQSGYAKFYQIKQKGLKKVDFGLASTIISQEWHSLTPEERSIYVKDVSTKRKELLKKKASQQAQDLLVQGIKQEQDT